MKNENQKTKTQKNAATIQKVQTSAYLTFYLDEVEFQFPTSDLHNDTRLQALKAKIDKANQSDLRVDNLLALKERDRWAVYFILLRSPCTGYVADGNVSKSLLQSLDEIRVSLDRKGKNLTKLRNIMREAEVLFSPTWHAEIENGTRMLTWLVTAMKRGIE